MEYCAPLGIPHSVFLQWDDLDRSKAISHMLWKKKFCSRCGTVSEEWLDDDGFLVEPPPYEAVTHVCHGCATLEEIRALLPKENASSTRYHTFLRKYTGAVEEWQMNQSQ